MKLLLRSFIANAVALFLVSLLFSGVKVDGGVFGFIFAGIVLSLMSFLLKPVLAILSLPFNLITFGLFSFFSGVILIYILTILLPSVRIQAFTFQGASFAGFIIPKVAFNTFFAYIISSLTFSAIINTIKWLFRNEAIY